MPVQEHARCFESGRYGHTRYDCRKRAREAAKWHVAQFRRGAIVCVPCWYGQEPELFRCATSDHVWHWGHRRRDSATPSVGR